jgi:hypothetical protein
VSDPYRTAGVIADDGDDINMPIVERIGRKAVRLLQRGVRTRSAFVSILDWWGFVQLIGSKVEGDIEASPYVTLFTPVGPVAVFPDRDAPSGTVEVSTNSARDILDDMQTARAEELIAKVQRFGGKVSAVRIHPLRSTPELTNKLRASGIEVIEDPEMKTGTMWAGDKETLT